MKPSDIKVLTRRLRMFKRDPYCYWCGCLTMLYGEQSQPDLATIDHLYSKTHPERQERYSHGHDRSEVLHVLACFSCNQERGKADQQGYLFVPDLEHRREFAREVSAINGIVAEKPQGRPRYEYPAMRMICTIGEAIRFAREHREDSADDPIKFTRQNVS